MIVRRRYERHVMSAERVDPKQIAAFRALARRISDGHSEEKFEEALRRLMAPAVEDAASPDSAAKPSKASGRAKQTQ
jgi:hypothetical protein